MSKLKSKKPKKEVKDLDSHKAMKEYKFQGGIVYAFNDKNAIRKAEKLGYLKMDEND